ncbi:MAG TPA: RlmE family RNA methyltransferase, partial [Polyangiaceae bacterium]|nr:RlmE family RNA methyltransferase [Polyangiaceae bacterium]
MKRGNPYAQADARTRQANAEGYPARSVYKLKEIDQRCKIFRNGQRVIDLGAAPGSWSLYASEKVGPQGKVFAIDLSKITQGFAPNVTVVQGDALQLGQESNPIDPLALSAVEAFDVVLSDMAPKTSGNKSRDQILSFELAMGALEVARRLGAPGSSFVAKIFMSGDFGEAKKRLTAAYAETRVIRPEGTRSISSEV